jgi:hypothetical protein
MFCLPTHENGNFFNPKLYCKGFIKWLLFAIMLTIITIIVYIILGIFFRIW